MKTVTFLLLLGCAFQVCAQNSLARQLFELQRQLAREGNPESMYILANMYERGRGVDKDYKKALDWYKEAAHNGIRRAVDKVADMQQKIHNDAKKEALQRLKSVEENMKLKKNIEEQKKISEMLEQQKREARLLQRQLDADKIAAEKAKKEAEAAALDAQLQIERLKQQARKAREESESARLEQQKIEAQKEALKKVQETIERKQSRESTQQANQSRSEQSKKHFKTNPCDGPTARFMATCR
jgi:hypothetical protein